MRDECAISRNLRVKQNAFFDEAAKVGFSVAVLAAKTEIPRATLDSYIDKPSRQSSIMSLTTFVRLASVNGLPPHVSGLLIDDCGHDLVSRDPHSSTWLDLGGKTAAFAAKVCRYQATGGHIDHIEDSDLRHDMIEIISEGQGALGGVRA